MSESMKPDWQPIETAPRENSDGEKRLLLWMPAMPHQAGCAAFGTFNTDKYSQRPRPFWDYEHVRVTDSRARQPTHWAYEPEGPK